jgi:hypothetical protein
MTSVFKVPSDFRCTQALVPRVTFLEEVKDGIR